MAQYEVEVKACEAEHPLYASWLAASTKRASAAAKAKAKRGRKAGKKTEKAGKAGKKEAPAGSSLPEADDSEAGSVSSTLLFCRGSVKNVPSRISTVYSDLVHQSIL